MTKRSGSYQIQNGKKPRLEEDEFWDEGLDDEALDKCFELATQLCTDDIEPSIANKDESILPPYNAFKRTAAVSSTQLGQSIATSSKKISYQELEIEIQKLKLQNKEKEGEISVLRSKIKEATTTVHVEQQRTTNEWREKLQVAQREAKAVKSDLEFKNLEIANLKQQLTELKRINIETVLNATQQLPPPPVIVKVNDERKPSTSSENIDQKKCSSRVAIIQPTYPLKSISHASFMHANGENHVINNSSFKISRNTIPYLQNQQTYNDASFQHKCPRLENKRITIKNVYPEIFRLVNSNTDELNSPFLTEAICKIICVTLILLKDLNDYIGELGLHMKTEDIQQADITYLLRTVPSENIEKSESLQIGIQASKILEVVSRLILCNSFTAEFICGNKLLKLPVGIKEYAKLIPHRNGAVQSDYYFLRLLLGVVNSIGKFRLGNHTSSFLVSAASVLENIAVLGNMEYMGQLMETNKLFCNLFREIVLSRPGFETLERISSLLKVSSRFKPFLQFLFRKNGKNGLLKAGPKGVLYYNEDACCFCVLAILLQNYILMKKKISIQLCYNLLSFIYNIFKTSHWIYHESEENVCVCPSQLYKLEIEIVFRALSDFIKHHGSERNLSNISEDWSKFLKHDLTQKVLNQMSFHNLELTEKYVMVFSQYKEIEKVLKSEGLFDAAQLNTSEELPNILPKSFPKDF